MNVTASPTNSAKTATKTAARPKGLVPSTDFASLFDALAKQREGCEAEWLRTLRREAMDRFLAHGLPSRKNEVWRYLNLASFAREAFVLEHSGAEELAIGRAVSEHTLPESAATLVFVNGMYSEEHSSIQEQLGQIVQPLSAVLGQKDGEVRGALSDLEGSLERPFLDLNSAFFGDGASIEVGKGIEVQGTIHLLFLQGARGPAQASFPRIVVNLGENSRATLVEEHVSLEGGTDMVASVTQVKLQAGAGLSQVRVQDAGTDVFQFASADVEIGKDASWSGVSLQCGAAIAREEVRVHYASSGGECEFACLSLADAARVIDIQADVVHSATHCVSRQTYRGVVDGKARAIFNSRVAVEVGAVGTDSGQSAKSLLLSNDAIADTKPQLEVLNDEVKCFHGATTGQLDKDALFFLRSRGIATDQARAMLTLAFAAEVVDAIPVPSLKERLQSTLGTRLAGARI